MSDEEDDDSQKTEDPSEKRLRDALERGQVVNSKELTNFINFIVFAIIIFALLPFLSKKTIFIVRPFIENSYDFEINSGTLLNLSKHLVNNIIIILAIPFSLIVISIILSSFIQSGTFVLSSEPIQPKLDKISIFKGFKRLFSLKSIVEFVKGIIKIIVVGATVYFVVEPYLPQIIDLYEYDTIIINGIIYSLLKKIILATCIILAMIGILDYLYQRYEYYKSLMMSKQDIKDEHKQLEGNPEIKAKLRKIRSQRANQRMMQAVPNADVILTNPTHFSVALEYKDKTMRAPKLIAKGQDLVALKIREIAKECDIPIVENPPLTRALYSDVEINQEIPIEHYKAVAEVINYIYKLKRKK